MSTENVEASAEQLDLLSSLDALTRHDLVRWRGIMAMVIDVARFGSPHDQVVLQRLNHKGLPLSMPVSDLRGAEIWHPAGILH